MTGFTHARIAEWRDGQVANWTGANVMVSYDQANAAYKIDPADMDRFVEWVACIWPGDNDTQEDDETTRDFLDRCGIQVSEIYA